MRACLLLCIPALSLLVVSGLSAQQETLLFHSSFGDSSSDLTNGSRGTATDSAWTSGGSRSGSDTIVGNDTTDVLVDDDYACRLVKHKGTSSLFAHAVLDSNMKHLHVGMWFEMEAWDMYDVPQGKKTDLFSIWNVDESQQAVRVMVAGDRQRSLLVEFQAAGGSPVVLGTEETDPVLEAGAQEEPGSQAGSVYLDSGRVVLSGALLSVGWIERRCGVACGRRGQAVPVREGHLGAEGGCADSGFEGL